MGAATADLTDEVMTFYRRATNDKLLSVYERPVYLDALLFQRVKEKCVLWGAAVIDGQLKSEAISWDYDPAEDLDATMPAIAFRLADSLQPPPVLFEPIPSC